MLSFAIIAIFIIGYILIIAEKPFSISKTASALIIGTVSLMLYALFGEGTLDARLEHIATDFSSICQIVFFLIGAMLIVETIDSHQGFYLLGSFLRIKSLKGIYWVVLLLSFFLSAMLDNLTTLIVIVSLLKKLIPDSKQRLLLSAAIVIAVNLGGAWTPIGDVTTTMLWIAERISTTGVIHALFIPSFASLLVLGLLLMPFTPKNAMIEEQVLPSKKIIGATRVLVTGLLLLLLVPTLKVLWGVPPYLGMLFSLSILWLLTDLTHREHEDRKHLKLERLIGRIDIPTGFFFLGILMAVDALELVGVLKNIANSIQQMIQSEVWIATIIGFVSAIVDNVPLVAACIRMYPLEIYPQDHPFWNLIAFCAGTGGSLLIIGSAPGIALMGLEGMTFGWYLKKMSWIALITYIFGVGLYSLML